MEPIFRNYALGDRVEESILFVEESDSSREPMKVIDAQWLAYRIFSTALKSFSVNASRPIQQEMIFLAPVLEKDEVLMQVSLVDVDETRNWVTFSIHCYKSNGESVITGQMVTVG